MAWAFDDATKFFHKSADPANPRFAGMLIASRTINPDALADMADLVGRDVPPRHWRRVGDRVQELTPAEKTAVEDAINAAKADAIARRNAALATANATIAEARALPEAARSRSERLLLALIDLGAIKL